jgi:hypothetical protein
VSVNVERAAGDCLPKLIAGEYPGREEIWAAALNCLSATCPAIERYFMIDPWRPLERWNKPLNVSPAEFDACLEDAMVRTETHAGKRVVLRGTTLEMIDQIPDDGLDFAYIDGDHTLRGITIDLLSIWPKLKPGGIIGGDDFVPSVWQHPARYEPTLVFPYAVYFAEAMDVPITALPYEQFMIEKRSPFSFADPSNKYGNLELAGELRPPRELFKLRRSRGAVISRLRTSARALMRVRR